jgi:hypothetical protein
MIIRAQHNRFWHETPLLDSDFDGDDLPSVADVLAGYSLGDLFYTDGHNRIPGRNQLSGRPWLWK